MPDSNSQEDVIAFWKGYRNIHFLLPFLKGISQAFNQLSISTCLAFSLAGQFVVVENALTHRCVSNCTGSRKTKLGCISREGRGGSGEVGLLSGKKWGGVEKENFTGPACMKGHPGQQYVIWEQLKTKPLQIVVSKLFRTKP